MQGENTKTFHKRRAIEGETSGGLLADAVQISGLIFKLNV
jgi:hypothetical protein